jgi:G3E family GTPase
MNEFGEIAIDSKVIEGKNIRIADLGGGCVCCSLQGEFEAAVNEVIDTVDPEVIVVETTGVAEPDALILNIQENLPRVRLDGVVTVADADALIRFPRLGHTTRMQIEDADTILLNKADLVSPEELAVAEEKLREINPASPVLPARWCQVDPDLLFGICREREIRRPEHIHQPQFDSFSHRFSVTLRKECFEEFATSLPGSVYRAKGFVRFPEGTYLFNYVAGRWELEPFPEEAGALVFIGRGVRSIQPEILAALARCEV